MSRRGLYERLKPPTSNGLKPKPLTVGKRWRNRRDYVIGVVAKHGCPIDLLIDVFDLGETRIRAIIRKENEC